MIAGEASVSAQASGVTLSTGVTLTGGFATGTGSALVYGITLTGTVGVLSGVAAQTALGTVNSETFRIRKVRSAEKNGRVQVGPRPR